MENAKNNTTYQYLVGSFEATAHQLIQNWLNKYGKHGFKFAHAYEYGGYQSTKMTVITLMKEENKPDGFYFPPSNMNFDAPAPNRNFSSKANFQQNPDEQNDFPF